jgi:hypothetical protein
MPTGYGRGFGRGGGGWGFGFRGSSPPWPYVGLGRGGLPRCGYFLSGAAGMPVPPAYPFYGSPPWAMPYYGGMAYPGAMPYGYAGTPVEAVPKANPYAPQMTREQELDFLRSKAEAIKEQLEQIDTKIKELETE